MDTSPVAWCLASPEPWTRYRSLVDLTGCAPTDSAAADARDDLCRDPRVQALIAETGGWPGYPLKRHDDARHLLHKLVVLADFGVRHDDPGMPAVVDRVMAHRSPDGPFLTQLRLFRRFGGVERARWTWMACDAPLLLYSLLGLGLVEESHVQEALSHLLVMANGIGYRCRAAPELGNFTGPGRKGDPCPLANLYALRVLGLVPSLHDSPEAKRAAEVLLGHWGRRDEVRLRLFGIGSIFRRLKYPFVWYDILHVVDALSHFPFVHDDPRFLEMVEEIRGQADERGRYAAGSMYRAWSDWSFANKKEPSPWLTMVVLRIEQRIGTLEPVAL